MTDRIQAIIESHNDVAWRKHQLPARDFADKIASEMRLDGVTFGEDEDRELENYVMEIIKEYFEGKRYDRTINIHRTREHITPPCRVVGWVRGGL